jgi:hypothetical protein
MKTCQKCDSKIDCYSKWEQSGFQIQYGLMSGCLIKSSEKSNWIPADNYREVE